MKKEGAIILKLPKDQKKYLVVQHNNLIEAHYRLTAQEKKLVMIVASMIQPDDKDFQDYWITVQEVKEIFDVSGESYYNKLRNLTRAILKKPLSIQIENGEMQCNWFSNIRYYNKEARIRFRFDPDLKPFLLELKHHFTKYELHYALKLKSFYSIRLYELLRQYLLIGKRGMELEEFRLCLGVEKNKLAKYNNLKRKAIDPAVKELNISSDIRVSYKEKKSVRRIIGIEFQIERAWIIPESIMQLLGEYKVEPRILSALDRNSNRGEKILHNIIQYVYSKKPTHSFVSYLCYCIDNGYGENYDSKQMQLFSCNTEPEIPVFPGLVLQLGDEYKVVEHGNILRFETGVIPEGQIRKRIKEGLYIPVSDAAVQPSSALTSA